MIHETIAKIIDGKVEAKNGFRFDFKTNPEHKRRTEDALKETEQLLKKELSFSKDLQKKDRVKELEDHIARLKKYLAQGGF